jgi:RNA recognition motif-containing protein
LKKKDRVKKLKQLYDRIKKQIKEKYRFCNLYIKNLPDHFDENNLRELFSKFGEIRSCKTVRKELYSSYLGIKRSVKVFGYVCFSEAASARDAKAALHNTQLSNGGPRLFVDYHQTKNERNDYLKLKMINQAGKMKDMPPMMRNLPPHSNIYLTLVRNMPPNFGPHMLRKFPPQSMGKQPGFPNQMGGMPIDVVDPGMRRDYYGERLFSKISTNMQFGNISEYYSKIVGIFLDLEDHIIERLIHDDQYFVQQVSETVRVC